MRILYFTDPHLTAKAPSSRKDIYYKTSFEKMMEIGDIAKKENVDIILCGGDLFHSPVVSLNYAGRIARIIQAWNKPFFVVPGNHDLFGYSISTINQTMLGMFARTNVVRLLTSDNPLRIKVGTRMMAIEGREYSGELDTDTRNYQPDVTNVDFNILINHGMLLDKEYIPGIHYTMTKDVEFPADITIGGHYHYGFQEHEVNGGMFFNPGSLFRTEASKANKTFQPKTLLLDIHDGKNGIEYEYRYIPLTTAKDSSEIFDFSIIQEKKNSTALLDQFKQFVTNTSSITASASIDDMVRDVAKDNALDSVVTDEALLRIQKSHVKDTDSLQANGYVEYSGKIFIKKIHLENFQSHEDTEIEFDEGFNVIVGETNSGKTSVLRALQWVLYNNPKGSDFIRTGADECTVSLYLSSGEVIQRKRTRDNAGEYILTDASGKSQSYKGFGSSIPIEIYNAHQMPPVQLSKDVSISLNVASQLEGPFLISMNPSEKANAIGRIIGSQVLDRAIKDVSRDVGNLTKEISSLKKQLDQKENDKKRYDFLPDYLIQIEQAKLFYEEAEKSQKEIEALKDLFNRYGSVTQSISYLQDDLERFEILPDLEAGIEKLTLSYEKAREMISIKSSEEKCSKEIEDISERLSGLFDVKATEKKIKEASKITDEILITEPLYQKYTLSASEIDRLQKNLEHIPQIDLKKIRKAEALITELEKAEELIHEYERAFIASDSADDRFREKERILTQKKKELEDEEDNFKKFLVKSKVCPLCEAPLTSHSINHIVGGES